MDITEKKLTNSIIHVSEGSKQHLSSTNARKVGTSFCTIIILSSDIPPRKPLPRYSPDNYQLIFGINTNCAPDFSITTHPDTMIHVIKLAQGLPFFLHHASFYPLVFIEPTADVLESSCPGIGDTFCSQNYHSFSIHGILRKERQTMRVLTCHQFD